MSGLTTALALGLGAGNLVARGGPLALSIGDVVFSDFEIPERLTSLGGTQQIAEHRFPGGRITQQTFGPFPNHLEWSGLLLGTTAFQRMRQLDRLRIAGQSVMFAFGETTMQGMVSEFNPVPHHQWLVPYTLKFQPSRDLTAFQPWDQILSVFSIVNSALNRLNVILGILVPSGGGSTLANVQAQLFYFPLPPTLAPPLTNFVSLSAAALQAALGLPQDISPGDGAAIVAAASVVQVIAVPLTQSTDPTVSSPAIDMLGYVSTVVTAVSSPTLQSVTTIQVTNPNLFTLAAQYYGDATRWQSIASASGIFPPDPMPVGSFTLTIPAVSS